MHPIMFDIAGYELDSEDKELLAHPLIGGLILFARNYHDPEQLQALTNSVRAHCPHPILIASDHEGGRVQRFREGFTRLPAMGHLQAQHNAIELAQACGSVAAYENRRVGVDLTLSPVCDLDHISDVIGDRGFSAQSDALIQLAEAYCRGVKAIGLATTGKHFPGHGNVKADSHVAIAIDERPADAIIELDMAIFKQLIARQCLDSIMPAHVIYPVICDQAAGFSATWLQGILREQLNFTGVIFSDDLSMHAATAFGAMHERVLLALEAGCDMALVCNDRAGVVDVLDNLAYGKQALAGYSDLPHNLIAPRVSALPQQEQRLLQHAYSQSLAIVNAMPTL